MIIMLEGNTPGTDIVWSTYDQAPWSDPCCPASLPFMPHWTGIGGCALRHARGLTAFRGTFDCGSSTLCSARNTGSPRSRPRETFPQNLTWDPTREGIPGRSLTLILTLTLTLALALPSPGAQ